MKLFAEDITFAYLLTLSAFLLGAIAFTGLDWWNDLKCNDQPPWWRNNSIRLDLFYLALNPLMKVTFRFIPVAVLVMPLLLFLPAEQIYVHLVNGWGPLAGLPAAWQCMVFIVASDFLLYWNHRLFHRQAMWPLHAIHHSPVDVDWTTAYRFHPLNFAFGPWLITTVMIFLGVSPATILFIAPLEAAMAYFVHSNLNVTLGPLKYIIATPVFHRWHHTRQRSDQACNFGANLSIWDLAFGTFHSPEGHLPSDFGVECETIPDNFTSHLIYPFTVAWQTARARLRRRTV